MLNRWHVRWVYWPCKNWDVFSFQELCTDPCNMGPCIIVLQHEVMVVDEWHNNGPQDLITVSLCIQTAINKMHLCSLSITYACPYHKPTATIGHSIHNIDISKPLTHRTPYTLSAIYPVQWKPGFIHDENTSPKLLHHRMWAFAHSSQLRRRAAVRSRPRWRWRACSWPSLRWFLTACAEIIWLCKLIVAAAVQAACRKRYWRWRCWMWRSWSGVVTHGLLLWGQLGVLHYQVVLTKRLAINCIVMCGNCGNIHLQGGGKQPSCRKESTTLTGHLRGSSWWEQHQSTNRFHFRA